MAQVFIIRWTYLFFLLFLIKVNWYIGRFYFERITNSVVDIEQTEANCKLQLFINLLLNTYHLMKIISNIQILFLYRHQCHHHTSLIGSQEWHYQCLNLLLQRSLTQDYLLFPTFLQMYWILIKMKAYVLSPLILWRLILNLFWITS